MKKISLEVLLLVLGIICLLTSACQTKKSSVFSNDCLAPCWRQIQPGRTTEQEVNDLLTGFSDIKADEIVRGGHAENNSNYFTFNLSTNVSVRIYLIDKIVVFIHFYNQDGLATFGNCIQEFGAPEFAVQSSVMGFGHPFSATSDWHTWFYTLNTGKGVVYGYDSYKYFGKNTELTPQTRVTDIEFYDTHSYETLLKEGLLIKIELLKEFPIENLYPWAGYGDIDKLYPEK